MLTYTSKQADKAISKHVRNEDKQFNLYIISQLIQLDSFKVTVGSKIISPHLTQQLKE